MAMLIYADEAKANIITFATECGSTVLPIDAILMILNSIDTVDSVEVVHCRDCKHYDEADSFNCKFAFMKLRRPYDFCSYGERKDGDGNG